MDIDRKQRTDIDTVTNDRLTLAIDESNIEDNPYVHETIKGMEGNNWVNEDTEYVKYNLVEDDNLILIYDPITKLSQKSINKVTVSFDYVLSNNINRPILDNISLVADSTYHEIVNYELNNSGHIDIDCEIFGIDEVVLNTIISIQGFGIGLNFNGKYSNATIRISNIKVSFKYSDKLYDESGSVINRLEPYIDFYRDDDGELILQIGGDASGKGMDRGGTIDTYSKTEIDNKLATKVDTQIGKGLSSNDYTNAEKTKLSGIAENANYYIHPSTHGTGIIVESNALTNLDTSSNATQHEINLAINDKIGQGGGGSVDWSDIENKPSDYPPSSHNHDDRYYTESEVDTALNGKQATLVSGTNIKTINNNSLLGSGNISIQGGGSVTVDSALSTTSENPVQNKVITGALNSKADTSSLSTVATSGSYNDLSNKPNIPTAISDLTNDSDFIETSSTTGLIKNDGSIDTNTYLTQHQDVSTWTSQTIATYGTLYVNTALRLCEFRYYRSSYAFSSTAQVTLHSAVIPATYRPQYTYYLASWDNQVSIAVTENGDILAYTSSKATRNIFATGMWHY